MTLKFPKMKSVTYTDTPIAFTAAQALAAAIAAALVKKALAKIVGIESETIKFKPKA